ncbi:MAG TPA: branched-chain amino acid ABC transporter permease [Chloroflexota bacterium]|jgi:branched-chain amino acid transport system permease protein
MPELASTTVNAILVAGLYATMSYGLALIWGVMKIINLSHAGVLMLGAYSTWWLTNTLHVDALLTLPITALLFFGLGMVIERLLVRRLADAPPITTLLLLFGLWLVLQNFAYSAFTGDTRSVLTPYSQSNLRFGPLVVPVTWLITFVIGLVILVLLQQFLTRTMLGSAIRALAQDRDACRLVGIDTERVNMVAFALGTMLAAVAGALLALLFSFSPEFGGPFQLKSFAIIVLGGLESLVGVAVAALIVALAEQWSVAFIPAALQNVVAFVILVVALVCLPNGIMAALRQVEWRPFRSRG